MLNIIKDLLVTQVWQLFACKVEKPKIMHMSDLFQIKCWPQKPLATVKCIYSKAYLQTIYLVQTQRDSEYVQDENAQLYKSFLEDL